MGYIDLHCHLLWDLDDGCRGPAETLAAARGLVAAGYTDVAASPHVQGRYAGGDPRLLARRLEEARALLAREGVPLALHASGEHLLDDHFMASLAAGGARPIGAGGRYVLVELPFLDYVSDAVALLEAVQRAQLTPVVAHPERCAEFAQRGRAAELVARGARLQLNLGSLTGRHGQPARRLAEGFLAEGLYAVAGTDLHNPDDAAAWIGAAHAALAARAGAAELARLCDENPRRVLAGKDLA